MAYNILGAIRVLDNPQMLQKKIDDLRLRLSSASPDERKSLEHQLTIAERMYTIKSQFKRYSDIIEHCLISNSWYVDFVAAGDGDYEDMLYAKGESNIRIYAVLFCRFSVEGRTPLFFIRLDQECPIEYGLYDKVDYSLINYSVEQIFHTIKTHIDYDTKLMEALPTYQFYYAGSIPVEVPEIGVHRNSYVENLAPESTEIKLYYGAPIENNENIMRDGIPADIVVDTYEMALQIAHSEAGGKDKGVVVYEFWVDKNNLDKKMPMINVLGNVDATMYTLKEGITDTSKMKLAYKSVTENKVESAEHEKPKNPKTQRGKHSNIPENQLTFWS